MLVPKNNHGKETDIVQEVELGSEQEAIKHFAVVRTRLLSPCLWHNLAGSFTAVFTLVDRKGHEKRPPAKKNDYLKIDIPGPGPKAGDSYDWVCIHDISEEVIATADESIGLQLMPCKHPFGFTDNTAHFFTEEASSTFIIKREGNIIHALYYGRNEEPNTDKVGPIDKVRNALVAAAAIAGVSEVQWTALLKGLLS